MTPSWDVVVVGCGPVGAFAANLFGRAGLRTLVLERDHTPYSLPRAVHFDHEMLRLLQDVLLLDRLSSRLREADGHLHIGADRIVIRHLSSAGQPRPFGYASDYFFYQPELEEELRNGLVRYSNVTLRQGVEVVALEQASNVVRVTLANGRVETAQWVVGTDGARSTVRQALGIELDDFAFDELWLVVDAEVDGPLAFDDLRDVPAGADLQRLSVMMCDPARPATVVPGRGTHRRWEFMLLSGENETEIIEPDRVRALVAPWVGTVPCRIIRAATYRFHGLVAHDWRRGRVFLAGDAAHQTPPFFGQGLCHGMRDAANLAWKLALVHSETAGPQLLDTYEDERSPQVRHVIEKAIEAGRYICLRDRTAAAERDARVRATPDIQTAGDLIAPIASSIVGDAAGQRFVNPAVDAGRHLLDAVTGGGWVLLSRGSMTLSAEAESILNALHCRRLRIGVDFEDTENHVKRWLDAEAVNAVWLRPDFYVAATGREETDLSRLIERLGSAMSLTTCGAAQLDS